MAKVEVPLKAEQADPREQTESRKASEPSAQPLSAAYVDLVWLPITRSNSDFPAALLCLLVDQRSVLRAMLEDRATHGSESFDKNGTDQSLLRPVCCYTTISGAHGTSSEGR